MSDEGVKRDRRMSEDHSIPGRFPVSPKSSSASSPSSPGSSFHAAGGMGYSMEDIESGDGLFMPVRNVEDDVYNLSVLSEETKKMRGLQRIRNGTMLRERSMSDIASGWSSPRNASSLDLGGAEAILAASASHGSADTLVEDVREQLFEAIPEPYPHSKKFHRVQIVDPGDDFESEETTIASKLIAQCLQLREKWIGDHPTPPQDLGDMSVTAQPLSPARSGSSASSKPKDPKDFRRRMEVTYDPIQKDKPIPEQAHFSYKMEEGVMQVFEQSPDEELDPLAKQVFQVLSFEEFARDYAVVKHAAFAGPPATYSYTRLEVLAAKFNLHVLLNDVRENDAQKSVPHRDFYNIRKVDTHVHHSACMNQKHLLRFIKNKLRTSSHEEVTKRDGKVLTLAEVFASLNFTAYDLSIDTLDMHAHDTFHRFDRFNLKYNPSGDSRLREIFLKTDNHIQGRYLAEITKEVFGDLEAGKYQLVEWRVSIYGRNPDEWSKLARWFYNNQLYHKNVRWLIQVPRLFQIYRSSGSLASFEEMLDNIFKPLFAVSVDPSIDPPLHYFLNTIVGFDSVDDESRPETGIISPHMKLPIPSEWTNAHNPPYGYWMYYMYANICTLNKLRASRGLCTFQFRPHCGEAGDIEHLVSTYLVADQINHGIQLRKNPTLQYLYYLSQIGIAVSPLSNNKLFLDYTKNPFPRFFSIGMNVSLSTDDPLMLHYTKDALLEEYSVGTQVWKLSSTDQSEIARNSVIQSGWEAKYKRHFLGTSFIPGIPFSDIRETNVPEIRLLYRKETLDMELAEILKVVDDQ